MTTRNIEEIKRFVLRLPDKKPKTYLVSASGSRPRVVATNFKPQTVSGSGSRPRVATTNFKPQSIPTREVLPSSSQSLRLTLARTDTPRTEATPPRRVVVIRNTKTTQPNQGPVDLGDFGQPNSMNVPPVINNGVSILLINLGFFVLYIREYFSMHRFISFDDQLHHLNHQKRVINVIINYVKYV
jgi:hypothetical protein